VRRLVHLSDLHFEHVDPRACAAVVAFVKALSPHLVVVTGDLTQRARTREFAAARAFLEALPFPRVVVPGNHDVPLWNLPRRILAPLARYRRYISAEVAPVYADAEIVVAGLNTAHGWTVKEGAITQADLGAVCRRLHDADRGAVKIVASHHPLPTTRLRGRGGEKRRHSVEVLVECGVDIFLTGHLHLSYAGHTATRYRAAGHSAIVVEAGTATSTRLRGETNGFNVLHVGASEVTVERLEWHDAEGVFRVKTADRFAKTASGWTLAPATLRE
jgi:3',5'-cyclic AMP phosphodiesterase CpdA